MKLDYEQIGIRIKSRRKQLDMTQKDLSQLVGLSEGSISRYEHGKVEDATLNVFEKFANALNVESSWLVGMKKQSSYETRIKAMVLKANSIPKNHVDKILDCMETIIDMYLEINNER